MLMCQLSIMSPRKETKKTTDATTTGALAPTSPIPTTSTIVHSSEVPAIEVLRDNKWVQRNFIKLVRSRDAVIGKSGTAYGGISVAKAVCDHMQVWWSGVDASEKDYFSMGVLSDGSYNVPENLYFSLTAGS